jgi:NTP pyrophosphatase (non-canonical NTP hydrolase)
MKRT